MDLSNLDDLGMEFVAIERKEADPAEPVPDPEPLDTRTNEDIRREALAQINNALDIDLAVVAQGRKALTQKQEELRDYVMTSVVPVVLSVEPALTSVQLMAPRMFDDSEDIEVELPVDRMRGYAAALGTLATKMKLIEMFDFSPDVKERLLARLIPDPSTKGDSHE